MQHIYNISDLYDDGNTEVIGSPYLVEEYLSAQVYSLQGDYLDVPMRYNVHQDIMEFKHEDSLFALEPNLLINKILLDEYTFVVEYYQQKKSSGAGYFIRLDSGKVSLLSKPVINYIPAQKGKPIQGDVPANYQHLPPMHFLKLPNSVLVQIKNLKQLLGALPDQQEEISAFVKDKKISGKKLDQFKEVIQYYNELN